MTKRQLATIRKMAAEDEALALTTYLMAHSPINKVIVAVPFSIASETALEICEIFRFGEGPGKE